jgi:hypothetical protein
MKAKTSITWMTVGLLLGSTLFQVACGDDSSAAASGGASSGTYGTGGVAGSVTGVNWQTCFACGNTSCSALATTCTNTDACQSFLECTLNCATGDTACGTACTVPVATNAAAVTAAANYVACLSTQCATACVPTVSGVGGAGSTASATVATTGCQGTPTYASCPAIDAESTCATVTGCSVVSSGYCSSPSGVPDCSYYYDSDSCGAYSWAGCYWSGGLCEGTPTVCSTLTAEAACLNLSYCSCTGTWSCSGPALSCTTQTTAAACATVPGCTWVN